MEPVEGVILAMKVLIGVAFIITVMIIVITKVVKRDLLNDRDELIKRVDDPYKSDFWNEG